MQRAPVGLFVYNRPRHTRETVEALRRNEGAAQTDLFVYADGPKHAGSEPAVREVRSIAHDITGFKSLTVIERPRNLGLRASITDGVNWLCERRGSAFI